jgi:hypothetical protein
MKRPLLFIVLLLVGCLSALFLMLSTSPVPAKCLVFTLSNNPTGGSPRRFSVTVSNATDSVLEYPTALTQVWFQVAYATNGVWQSFHIRTIDSGDGLLQPHAVMHSQVEVPEATDVVKVGLGFTSLAWMGRLAWKLTLSPAHGLVRPLTGVLSAHDARRRSKSEWSSEYRVVKAAGASTNTLWRVIPSSQGPL